MSKRPKGKDNTKELDAKERELFLNAFYQKNKVPLEKYSSSSDEPIISEKRTIEEDDAELFLRAVDNEINSGLAKEKFLIKKPRSLIRAKKRDAFDAKIDLHAMYAEDAVTALLRFLEREKRRGSRSVLIVHGKGAGILKNAVWSIIESHHLVGDFKVAPVKLGGEGAILVRLKRKIL